MDLFSTQFLFGCVILAVPIAFCLTVHEYAHARSALALGDPTAKNQGRCSFDPLVHIDPLGLIMFFVMGFGWAKPVPVDYSRLGRGGTGRFIVAASGISVNLITAVICAIILRAIYLSGANINPSGGITTLSLSTFLITETMLMSLALCFFNLIPLFPLDGHHMLREMLPNNQTKYNFMRFQMTYGHYIILGLLIVSRFLPFEMDPIGIWFDRTLWPTALLITGDSWELCYNALSCYSDFTPF